MKIHKLVHCCLVIEMKALDGSIRRIMTDPGFYSLEEHIKAEKLDMVLITHEHGDHFHIESLKEMLKRMPNIEVIVNDSVAAILEKEGIRHRMMKKGDSVEHAGIKIQAFGEKHAVMHSSIPASANVGFYLGGAKDERSLFIPGDAFTDPKREVDVLGLPVTGPWMKVSEAIDYALQLQPRVAFPIHDASGSSFLYTFFENVLGKLGVEFIKLEANQEFVFK